MESKVKWQKISMTKMFLLIIGIVGLINMRNILKFYINDEKPTSEWENTQGNKFESDYTSVFAGKNFLVDFNGLVRNIMKQKEMNGVIKLQNDYLAITDNDSDVSNVISNAELMNDWNGYLAERNIPLLFVIVPDTICKYDEELPEGVKDYTNYKLDVFVENLEGVDKIDLRDTILEDEINHYDLFYKTDHHWNVYGGMYAASKILQYVEEKLEVDVDDRVFDEKSYYVETYPEWHLGSRGQRVGRFFAGIDDFEILIPKFDTDFTRIEDNVNGKFEDVFLSYDVLKEKNNMSRYTYDFTYKYTIENSFHNNMVSIDKTIMVITDSMGRVVTPYLGMAFENMYCTVYNQVDEQLLDSIKPDIIVVLLHPNNIESENHLRDIVKFKVFNQMW